MSAKNNPRLSVIIPTYNIEIYLRECLDSVVNQTYRNLEIIIIDDNSADSTPDIIKEYAANDDRIKPVFHETNHGPGNTRNEGLDLASGDYVTFMDHDDWQDLTKYEKMMREAVRHNADIVFSNAREYNERTKRYKFNYYTPPPGIKEKTLYSFADLSSRGELFRLPFPPWAKIVKRQLTNTMGARFSDGENKFDDLLFHYSVCIFAESCVYIDEPLTVHRLFPASITGRAYKNRDMFFDVIKAWYDIADFCQKHAVPPREVLVFYSRPLAGFMCWVHDWREYTQQANNIFDAFNLSADDFPREYKKFYWRIRKNTPFRNALHRARVFIKPLSNVVKKFMSYRLLQPCQK